jgi:CBS domain containing-hemolysin-like protein
MSGLLFICIVIVLGAMVVVSAISPTASQMSRFELKRRRDETGLDRLRTDLYGDVTSLQRVAIAVLLVVFVLLSVVAFGWLVGSIVSIVVALEYGALARLAPIRRFGQHTYDQYERAIFEWLAAHPTLTSLVRSVVPSERETRLDSKEELEHVIAGSNHILSDDEMKLIIASLSFEARQVREIMTPKSVIETIKKGEILGPLVLDDLHKTGHSRFPVIDGDIDHIVGILHIKDVLTLDTSKKHTSKVESAMNKHVHYIRDDHTLDQALSAFLSTHSHLFVVINEFRETVGILTLEDTLEALLGRSIIDEFDAHDDMRAVAARKAKHGSLNHSSESVDV